MFDLHSITVKGLSTLFSPIIEHIKVLYGQFDPVLDAPPEITKLKHLTTYRTQRAKVDESKHHFFIFVFILFIFNIFDNWYCLALYDYDYYGNRIPELFYHKIFPEAFWPQSDLIMVSIMSWAIVAYYNLWRGSWLDDRYCMYFIGDGKADSPKLIVNNQVWNQPNAAKIYTYRQANRRLRKICLFGSYFFFEPYFQYHLWTKPERGLRHTAMAVYIGLLLVYTVLSCILLPFYFFLVAKYIIIKQNYLLTRLGTLLGKLRSDKRKTKFYKLYTEFYQINQHLAYQCNEIRGLNRFWSIYLSAALANNIFCAGYYLYSFIFIAAPLDAKVYYIFAFTELSSLVFMVIFRSSIIDANNDLFYDRNVKIGILFQLHFSNIPLRLKANIDTISTNRNFSRCCFRLKNGYRLDSSAFNAALFMITTFFFSITKRAHGQTRF